MIRVRTGSRLHFGLMALPSEVSNWPNTGGQVAVPRRRFGGVGMMIDHPGIELTVEHASQWSAQGPLSERAIQFAQKYCANASVSSCFCIKIHHAAPEHAGLGTGTQLALAVARGIAKLARVDSYEESSATLLAKRVGRGLRSSIGTHGFAFGGLMVDGGKIKDDEISPNVASACVPEDWNVLLVLPQGLQGAHGKLEINAFAEIAGRPPDDAATDALCRIVLLGLLPAIYQNDFESFSESVYDYNRRAGEMFRSAQRGVYANERIEHIVNAIRGFGVKAVGQSSWGPAVFAITLQENVQRLQRHLELSGAVRPEEMVVTQPRNQGAVLSTEY